MTRDNIVGTLHGDDHVQGALSVGGGTTNYEELENKPSINGVELVGNMTIWQPFDLMPDTEYDTGIKWNNQTLYCMVVSGAISGNYLNKSVAVDGYVTPITSIWAIDRTDDIQLIDDPNYFKERIVGGGNNNVSVFLNKNNAGAYGSNNPVRVLVFYTKS